MDLIVTIVMMVPVLLAVALIVGVIRKNITEREPGDPIDITGAIPAVVILMVAVLIIGSMGASISPYWYDEDSGELEINKDVTGTGAQEWDSYGTSVKSLVINSNVTTVADGAFDTLTGLEYISISDNVESITSSAFGVTLKDCLDQTITEPPAGEYVGAGDGILYLCDESVYTYSSDAITGLSSSASEATVLVLPSYHGSTELTSVGNNAFKDNTTVTKVFALPKSTIATIGVSSFQGCTALSEVHFPDGLALIRGSAFGTAGIAEAVFPDTLETIEGYAFQGCSSLSVISFPASIQTVAIGGFGTTNGVTSITFAEGFNPSTMNYGPWNFYASDGETQLEKTAANLAGKTFQGISTALVELLPDRSALTTEQTLQVQELTKKAALTETKTLAIEEKELASA